MAEIINLNKARKAKARAAGKAAASENRVKHGRTKGEKAGAKLEAERARKELEGKKRPSEPAHPAESRDPDRGRDS